MVISWSPVNSFSLNCRLFFLIDFGSLFCMKSFLWNTWLVSIAWNYKASNDPLSATQHLSQSVLQSWFWVFTFCLLWKVFFGALLMLQPVVASVTTHLKPQSAAPDRLSQCKWMYTIDFAEWTHWGGVCSCGGEGSPAGPQVELAVPNFDARRRQEHHNSFWL